MTNMKNSVFKFLACSLLLSVSLLVLFPGCKKEKVFTIGVVNINPGLEAVIDGFKSGLSGYGFIEGKNITFIYKGTLNIDQVDAELKDLTARRVDLILALTTPVAVKARKAAESAKIPVVFAPVLFPVKSGLVKSLTLPGANITGIQAGGSTAKALEWHKSAAPESKNIFVPYKPDEEAAEQSLSDLKKAALQLGITLIIREVSTLSDLKTALESIPREADSIWLLNSPFLVSNIDLFVSAAVKRKLKLSSGTSQYRAGVMISYGQDPFRTGEQAGRLAHRILEGVPPAELPVETADFSLGINLKTARAIGVKIPDEVLQQADNIIR
jgi:putative ABC transport system substrate-binding protein